MGEGRFRETWAEVSTGAIASNARKFKSLLRPGCLLMAVVKANGYGHGLVASARAALRGGADRLAVAVLDEAYALREAGVRAPLLVLGYTPEAHVEAAIRLGVALTVFGREQLPEIEREAARLGATAHVHLKVDTGMSRLGIVSPEAALDAARQIARSPLLKLEGVFTHFADADGEDPAPTLEQAGKFENVLANMRADGIVPGLRHCCNSAATLKFPELHGDMVRVGIGLYGLPPLERNECESPSLRRAMTLKTRIASLKPVAAGMTVSYGRTRTLSRDSMLAVLPIGYADGLRRGLSNRASVLVRDTRAPIVGRVCMDQTIIDVTEAAGVRVGDEVVLFGEADGEGLVPAAEEWAGHLDTIHYEIVCGIGPRVPRIYDR
ncbi:alanine racemase [Cohnella xylanilytica]|uniref:Alanine racemase n=2 Tax=Cohnella xylanilytica TaxID=557555 RepID=A0A841U1P7_9BACL|nr:alanine racemase [Cohnella xylanilytica]